MTTLSLSTGKAITAVAFSPDGSLALTGSDDHTVRLWDSHSGRGLHVFESHSATVAFSPDCRHVHSTAANGTHRSWDAHTAQPLPSSPAAPAASAISPDGRLSLALLPDFSVEIRQTQTGRVLHLLRGHTAPVLSGARDRSARIWSAETGAALLSP